jgi:hypothetical protein
MDSKLVAVNEDNALIQKKESMISTSQSTTEESPASFRLFIHTERWANSRTD